GVDQATSGLLAEGDVEAHLRRHLRLAHGLELGEGLGPLLLTLERERLFEERAGGRELLFRRLFGRLRRLLRRLRERRRRHEREGDEEPADRGSAPLDRPTRDHRAQLTRVAGKMALCPRSARLARASARLQETARAAVNL